MLFSYIVLPSVLLVLLTTSCLVARVTLMVLRLCFLYSSWYLCLSFYGLLLSILILTGVCVLFYYISCIASDDTRSFFSSPSVFVFVWTMLRLLGYYTKSWFLFKGITIESIFMGYSSGPGIRIMCYLIFCLYTSFKIVNSGLKPSRGSEF